MPQAAGVIPTHFLHPCTIFVHREEHDVSTILGSCISVCLWDPQLRLGGINHYMLPLWNGEGLPTPKYGNIAIETLIDKMLSLGSRKDRLIAKVFGGARVIAGDARPFSVGDRNITVACENLATHSIPLAAVKVGGTCGIKIRFNTQSGIVLLAKLSSGGPSAAALPDGRPTAAPFPSKGRP